MIRQATRYGLFPAGERVGLAVSGGADSMCLLHLLHEIAPRWNLRLSVVHVEHGIRGAASRADAEFVALAASALGLPFYLHSADAPAMDDNLEQAARRIRHGFYAELRACGKVDRIATGHTASDQAETVLYRILRGSGLTGLSGIRPVTAEGLVRPLLTLWRADVEGWLRERNFVWREDRSNQDLTLDRNRLRHETLPMLREAFNPNLDQALAQMATLAQDEEAYWEQSAANVRVDEGPAGGPAILGAECLAAGPPALGRRQIRHAIERVKGDLRQIEFVHVEAILEMARAGSGHNRTQLPGLDVMRSFDWIRIARAGFESGLPRDFEVRVEAPGSVAWPGGGNVTFELNGPESAEESYGKVGNELDWQRLLYSYSSAPERRGEDGAGHGLLELRNWRPGDQYQPVGQLHAKKLKTLFQESRIPLWERRHWPVLTCRGHIVWTRRFGVASELAGKPGGPVLRIRETLPPD